MRHDIGSISLSEYHQQRGDKYIKLMIYNYHNKKDLFKNYFFHIFVRILP